ncbi:MAG: hypothetical protein K6E10_11450 [Eubacterium sp.]|nr:hypothetical protein [Eubacterium sp.]
MVEFEKVEKLVQKANVSYEDAKAALENANGDMLDAMIALERAGKAKKPGQSTYTTGPESQTQYRDVPYVIEQNNRENRRGFFSDLGSAIRRGFRYTIDTSISVTRKGSEIIKLPLWISIIALLCAWELLLVVVVVSLFFDCRYSLVGKNSDKKVSDEVNDIMGQASDFAGKVRASFNESFNNYSAAQHSGPEDSIYRNTNNASKVNPEDVVDDGLGNAKTYGEKEIDNLCNKYDSEEAAREAGINSDDESGQTIDIIDSDNK